MLRSLIKHYDWQSLEAVCSQAQRNLNLDYFRAMLKGVNWRSNAVKKAFTQGPLDCDKLYSTFVQESPRAKLDVVVPLHINMRASQPALFDKAVCKEVMSYL